MTVLVGHFQDFLALPKAVAMVIAGGFGVSFFFVLSGFILCYRYWDTFAGGIGVTPYRRYFVARIARVYPSYVLALVLITALYLAVNLIRPGTVPLPGNALVSWLMNLLALQTFAPSYVTQQIWNAPGWSISTEFGFYVACPFILAIAARFFSGAGRLWVLLALTVAYAVAVQLIVVWLVFNRGWNQQYWLDIVASRNIFWHIQEFMAGVIAARLLYGGHLPWLREARFRNALLVAGLALVVAINVAPWPDTAQALLTVRQIRFEVAYMFPFAAIILALAAGPTFATRALSNGTMVFLGEISYGIYIFHWIPWTVLVLAKGAGWNLQPLFVTGVILVTIAFSAVSYVWYEKPARRWIRKTFSGEAAHSTARM